TALGRARLPQLMCCVRPRTRTSTLIPYPTLFRSACAAARIAAPRASPSRVRGAAGAAAGAGRGGGSGDRAVRARGRAAALGQARSEEHTSELQSRVDLVCGLLLERKDARPAGAEC